jgi:hypothetical protein
MATHQFKTTNIKGKEYVTVNERVKFFRNEYPKYSMTSELLHLDDNSCVVKCTITNDNGFALATGFAQEDRSSSMVNKTSYVENAETSAWGRALANLGIGIDTSIASAQEVQVAVGKQNLPEKKEAAPIALTESILANMKSALTAGKTSESVVFDALKTKYGKTEDEARAIVDTLS